ncbi:MAG TPA: hypothetical protein VGH84_12130, partial [Steroidobacteraceae bacterium]
IVVTKAQLDQLDERGYLNPGDRGTTSARRLRAFSRIRWQNPDSLRTLCGWPHRNFGTSVGL